MDKVVFDGVEYTKASVAAKELRYTSDYIGQLCRSKKIDARLVGRTWFVNLTSVQSHKQNKYQAKAEQTKSADKSVIAIDTKLFRAEQRPVEQRRTVRPMEQTSLANPLRKKLIKVAYEIDDEYLIPKITKLRVKPPRTIVVEQANALKVRVAKGREKKVLYEASELPEVSLSGKINVVAYPEREAEEGVEGVAKNKDISDKREGEKSKKVIQVVPKLPHLAQPRKYSAIKPLSKHTVFSTQEKGSGSSVRVAESADKTEYVANTGSSSPLRFSPDSVDKIPATPVSGVSMYLPAIATLVAIVCVGLIFSANASVYVSGVSYDSQLELQLANLLEILNR